MACRGHQTRLTSAPKTTAKMILTGNEGRAVKSHAPGGGQGVCSAGGEGRGLLCPKEQGRVGTLSKAVTPDPISFPATSGPTPCPLPSAGPTFAEDVPPHISLSSQNALCSPNSRLARRHHTQHPPRHFCCRGCGFAKADTLNSSTASSQVDLPTS